VDRKTGAVVWKSGPGAAGYATAVPLVSKGRHLVALFSPRELVALDPQTGTVAWRHPWKTRDDINAADPVIIGERLLLSSGDDRGVATLELAGGAPTVLRENKNLRTQFTLPVVPPDSCGATGTLTHAADASNRPMKIRSNSGQVNR
jgi:outer membrane protein assembly factor BamB